MATAGEGGPTGSAGTNSSYGAGGKFRKKPLRRATTPYERPPPLLRPNTDGSWLKKMVVDSASKFISYGANRFFAPLFRKRLTPTPPPRPEVNHETSEEPQGIIPNHVAQEHQNGDHIQAISSSSNQGISNLEQLLKQKTFTRSEIDHLTDLLQSRVVEVSVRDERENKAVIASDSGRVQQFGYGHSNQIGNGVIRSNGVTSTPIFNSKVIEENVASPAELAKAYMGKRPSNVSPPIITASAQALERSPLLSSTMFALKSPMTARTPVKHGALENGFITPRSRGRSAIYNMARTPYSRVLPTSTLKGNGFNGNGYAGSSLSLLEPAEKLESKSMTLKRRSSTLDDEIGSVGPIRRIRQKPNLLAPRISHSARGLGIDSGKQKLTLIDGASMAVEKDENESTPSTSYGRVPANSSKVAARILQHLENLGSAEKPSESKLVDVRDKPFQLKQSMLHGKALRSMEDVNAFELPLDVQDVDNLKELSNVESDKRNLIYLNQGIVQENGPKESVLPSHKRKPAKDSGSSMSLKASSPSYPISDLIVRNNVSQPPQKKRAFRMSFEEDSIEQDDDLQSNGVTPESHNEGKGSLDARPLDNNLAPATKPETLNTTIQPEVTPSSGLLPIKTVENGDTSSVKVGAGSSSILFGAITEAGTPFSSVSSTSSDKPGQANPPTLTFGTKVHEKVPSFNIEPSTKVQEPKLESSSSLTNTTTISSQPKKDESEKDAPVNPPKLPDGFGKSENNPVASNEPVVPKPIISFGSSSLNITGQIPLGNSQFSTTPTITPSVFSTAKGTSTSTTSFGSMFGAPSISTQPAITFGASVDTSIASSTPSEAQTKLGSISQPTTTQAFSGNTIFGFSAPAKPSAENNQGSSLFDTTSKPISSGDETSQKVAKVEPVPVSSLPPFTMNNSTSFGSSPSFGFSSSAVSTDATKTTTFSFGLNSQAASTTSVSAPAPATAFSFGINASGSSDSLKFGASSPAPAPLFNFSAASSSAPSATFNFGSSSSAPTPVINNTSSSSSNAIFNFGASASTPNSNITTSTIAPAPANPFVGNTWKNNNSSSMFGSSAPAPSTGFVFGSSTTTSTPPVFPFAASSPLPTTPAPQPIFPTFGGGSGFGTVSPGNNDQMHAEDSMAEDNPVQQQEPVRTFGLLPVNPPQTAFNFGGQTAPAQANPFQFNTQTAPANPNPFQSSGSLDAAGGSFSLGTSDKSARRYVKPSRSKNRKK